MKLFNLEIVGNNGIFYQGKVKILNIPGISGNLGILANHSPILTVVKIGYFSFIDKNNFHHKCFSSGGILFVKKNKNYFLGDNILYSKNLNQSRAEEIKENIIKRIKDESSKSVLKGLNRDLTYVSVLTRETKNNNAK